MRNPPRSCDLHGGFFAPSGLPKPLPLGEVSPKVTERASPFSKSRCAAMGRLFVRAILSLCKSCLAAALPSQSRRKLLAKAGLRLPASASLPLASCWPLPQQLLPVSATGGGRRRCPKGGAIGMSVRLSFVQPLSLASLASSPSRGASGETVHFAGTAKASPR